MKVPLTRHKIALVDTEDYIKLKDINWWCKSSKGKSYAYGWINGKEYPMHRFIINPPAGLEVDHINGDSLDNRKQNLRICTHKENGRNRNLSKRNTSGYHGVSFDKQYSKWAANISINGKQKRLGRYDTVNEAAEAYNQAAKKYHGLFATLNKILPLQDITKGVELNQLNTPIAGQ